MRLKYLCVIKFRYLNVPCEGRGCTPPPLTDNFGVWGFMTLPLGFQLPKCASPPVVLHKPNDHKPLSELMPQSGLWLPLFPFWSVRDVLHRLNFPRDIFIDPRTRERNNVSDQLVPSLTQLGQANGQLVPHQLKPTTGKYLSSLRHLRSRLLVRSLPNM